MTVWLPCAVTLNNHNTRMLRKTAAVGPVFLLIAACAQAPLATLAPTPAAGPTSAQEPIAVPVTPEASVSAPNPPAQAAAALPATAVTPPVVAPKRVVTVATPSSPPL